MSMYNKIYWGNVVAYKKETAVFVAVPLCISILPVSV